MDSMWLFSLGIKKTRYEYLAIRMTINSILNNNNKKIEKFLELAFVPLTVSLSDWIDCIFNVKQTYPAKYTCLLWRVFVLWFEWRKKTARNSHPCWQSNNNITFTKIFDWFSYPIFDELIFSRVDSIGSNVNSVCWVQVHLKRANKHETHQSKCNANIQINSCSYTHTHVYYIWRIKYMP